MAKKLRQVTNKSIWKKNASVPISGCGYGLSWNRLKISELMVLNTGKDKQAPKWMDSDDNEGAWLVNNQCIVETLHLSIPAPQEKKS